MAEIIFELGINLIETLIIIDFVTRYLGCKYQGALKVTGFVCAWLISFIELSAVNYIVPFEGIAVFIPVAINFVYALIFLEGKILMKLWISALIEIMMLIIAVGTNLFVCSVIGYDPNKMMTVFNGVRIISVIITKVILFHSGRLVLRRKYKNPMAAGEWLIFILIPVTSLISISVLMAAVMKNEEIKGYILFGVIGILIMNMATYYFFTRLNREYETKLEIKLLKKQNENDKKYIEGMESFAAEMKSARHNIKHHLLVIYEYISLGKTKEAQDYTKNLIDNYLPYAQNFINTANDAFNAVLNSKIAVCNRKRIYIEIKAENEAIKDLDPVDAGVLFGNLLDNAIEAADKTKSRNILVDVHKQGGYMSVLVTNSIAAPVLENNTQLQTTKSNTELHGAGIKTIKSIVKKYDGMLQFYEEYNEFCCHILLDVNKR